MKEYLWAELEKIKPSTLIKRAKVKYEARSRRISFSLLGKNCFVSLSEKVITGEDKILAQMLKKFSFEEVILLYLLRAEEISLAEELVSPWQLRGGNFFFRGPHQLFTQPLLEKFGQDKENFRRICRNLGGEELGFGDAAFKLFVFPRLPLVYILREADEEFEATVSVLFDRTADQHLSLDALWNLVAAVSWRLSAEAPI